MKVTKFLFFSCPHAPLTDEAAKNFMLEQVQDFKPDVIIHGGDGHEADSASKFPSERDWSLKDELDFHNDFLREIREVSPGSRKVFLIGNHDDNILGNGRINSKIRGLADFLDPKKRLEPELIDHWETPTKYIYNRKDGVFRLGQVTFCHGFEAGVSADELQSIQLGLPYGLFVSGHTHRPVDVTQAMRTTSVKLPYWFANAGTLCQMEAMHYMNRKRREQWGQAVVVGEVSEWRYTSNFMPTSPQWDAETRIFRFYGE